MNKFDYTLDKNGFDGKMFLSEVDNHKRCAVITFTGSDGNFRMACKYAQYFQKIGMSALALAYWKGMPAAFKNIPIESIENAVNYLKSLGYKKIVISGISKGGELALLAGSLLQEIDGIIAVSPMFMVCGGFDGYKSAGTSSWSFRGKSLPYTDGNISFSNMVRKSLISKEYSMRGTYDEAILHPKPESIIQVEQIQCPVLLISAEDDSIWPSQRACEKIVERLQKKEFSYLVKHLNYKYLSHFAVPFRMPLAFIFRIERKYRKECDSARVKLDMEIRQWLYDCID